jgi:DNA polymerase-3 subunit gamma/tau
MIVLRLVYAADLPTPGDLIKQIQNNASDRAAPSPPSDSRPSPQPSANRSDAPMMHGGPATAIARNQPDPAPDAQPMAMQAAQPEPEAALALPDPKTYRELVRLFSERKEGILEFHLASSVRLVRFEPGVIEINPLEAAPPNLANRVGSLLSEWTGRRWVIGISSSVGDPTLSEADQAQRNAAMDSARASPTVQALMDAFPGAVITDVRDLAQAALPVEDAGDQTYPADNGELIPETGDEP